MFESPNILRPMTEDDLDLVLQWRNDPKISGFMYTKHQISIDEHKGWFEVAKRDKTRRLLMYEYDGKRLGYVQFSGVQKNGVGYWGLYAAVNAPKGTGRKLGEAALFFAFEDLQLHKVGAQVLEYNERSILFHESLGFIREGLLRDHYFDGASHHAIICYGLLHGEWSRDKGAIV